MKNHKEKKTRKAKSKACLFSTVSPLILQLEFVAEIWEHLREEYQDNERVRNMHVMNLIREFEMVRMNESQTIKDYVEQLLTIANKVRLLGNEFSDHERVVQIFFVILPKKYEATISFLENSKDLSSITLAELLNTLQALEQRRLMRSTSESWLVDSSCTNHMTYDQDLFREIDRTTISKVKIGNCEYIPVKGLKLISDVLFVSDIDQNLLSVGQHVEKGFKVCFKDRNCIIKDDEGRNVFNIKMKGKSFALNMSEEEQVDAAQHENNTMLWHKRLGHFHHNAVLYMKKNQIVEGLVGLEEELPICVACQYGKQTRLHFPKKTVWKINTETTIGSHRCWWTSEDTILEREFSDSDWAGCVDDMRSTSGYCFNFGYGVFSWSLKKQEVVTQSTVEAEYIVVVAAVNQALWLRKLLTDLDIKQEVSTRVFEDNQAIISIAMIQFFMKEGDIQLVYYNTKSQNADILTKALLRIRFEFLQERLGVCNS
uniref:Uncharacterized protein n=1 Tax=Vitis vinifera TaxID=29760 RepID=A5B0S0_VITVI|nr:hypothetical protein VITISV_013542 [Vitis vinifera]